MLRPLAALLVLVNLGGGAAVLPDILLPYGIYNNTLPPSTKPALAWTQGAEDLILKRLNELQYPKDCTKAKWLAVPHSPADGVGFRMRMFHWPLSFALLLNRTVVDLPPTNTGFQHLFSPFTSCGFATTEDDPSAPYGWDTSDRRSVASALNSVNGLRPPLLEGEKEEGRSEPAKILSKFTRSNSTDIWLCETPQCSNVGESVAVPGGYFTFPQYLWYQLASQKMVYWTSGDKEIPLVLPERKDWTDGGNRRRDCTGDLTVTCAAVTMLHALLTKWMLGSHWRKEIANFVLRDMNGWEEAKSPVALVHVRRTDKTKEDSYWRKHGETYRPLAHFGAAIETAALAHARDDVAMMVPTVYLMTDAATVIDEELESNILCDWKSKKRLSYLHKRLYTGGEQAIDEVEEGSQCLLVHSEVTRGRGDIAHKDGSLDDRLEREKHMLAELLGGISVADLVVGGYTSNLGAVLLQGVEARAKLAPVQPFLWDKYDLPPNGIKGSQLLKLLGYDPDQDFLSPLGVHYDSHRCRRSKDTLEITYCSPLLQTPDILHPTCERARELRDLGGPVPDVEMEFCWKTATMQLSSKNNRKRYEALERLQVKLESQKGGARQ